MATDFVKKWQTPQFHRSDIQKWNGISLPQCISCENFVKFGPVTPELTELICEHQVTTPQKTGAFRRIISPDMLDRSSQTFRHMKALYVQIMEL